MAKTSDLPAGAQFSPNVIDLPIVLEIVHDLSGDREAITDAIRDKFFIDYKASDYNKWKMADNVVLALRDYGLLDEEGEKPTELASELFELSKIDLGGLYERFGQHILLECRGLQLCESLTLMKRTGHDIKLTSIRRFLEGRGIHVPRGGVHISSMRLWLAQAGIFDKSAVRGPKLYEVKEEKLEELLGTGLDEIDRLTELDAKKRAFLRALVQIPENDPLVGSIVAEYAEELYYVEFDYKSLPSQIYTPLEDLGYIVQEKTTSGRGAKSNILYRTDKFFTELSIPILNAASQNSLLTPKELYSKPLAEIYADLSSEDTYTKGRSLELLTIYLSRILDLEFKEWRKRSAETGGAEVDVLVEGDRLIFSRWQIQAKNTTVVNLEEVAKEVGLALTFLYSNVILMVTTGNFTKDAYQYSDHVMRESNLNIIMFNGNDLEKIANAPLKIIQILKRRAKHAMDVKSKIYETTRE